VKLSEFFMQSNKGDPATARLPLFLPVVPYGNASGILVSSGPLRALELLHKVTKAVPFKGFQADGTLKRDFSIRHAHNLPVTLPRTVFNGNFLTHGKIIGFE
jgi:hypothetical protein